MNIVTGGYGLRDRKGLGPASFGFGRGVLIVIDRILDTGQRIFRDGTPARILVNTLRDLYAVPRTTYIVPRTLVDTPRSYHITLRTLMDTPRILVDTPRMANASSRTFTETPRTYG